MAEWPCCYDPLRLSLGSYDLFFTNISPPLSLSCPRCLWVTEVDEPKTRPRVYWGTEVHYENVSWVTEVHCAKVSWGTEVQYQKYPGERKCSTETILGNGRRLRENILGNGRRRRLDSRRSCRAKSRPAARVLRSSVPQSDFHSHPP